MRLAQKEGPPEGTGPGADWSHDPMLWPYTATKLAMDACFWWMESFGSAEPSEDTALSWTTPNEVALELPTLILRDFSRRRAGPPALICAPYALHGALIADLAPGHSLIEALGRGLAREIFLQDDLDIGQSAPEAKQMSAPHNPAPAVDQCLERRL